MSVDIKLKRLDRIYREGEVVSGVVILTSKDGLAHQGITLTVEGIVNLQLSAKNVGVFEAFYNSIKPVQLMNSTLEVAKSGKIAAPRTEIPFEFPLKGLSTHKLYESYHGVFVNISYTIRVDVKRSAFSKDLSKTLEFLVEDGAKPCSPKEVSFRIDPTTMEAAKAKNIPNLVVEGKIHSAICSISKPFTGELKVVSSDTAIKSIEVQLVRVETCGCQEGFSKDSTEIQNIQIGEGDVMKNLLIPIYMVFPRLFTCPTTETDTFKIEFEVNVVIVLANQEVVTENFPIKLVRDSSASTY
eukprot:m.134026 g.134026  ORF g.134026 m.134026 type:complete len:299 (+) comp52439_c1_seq1:94-990(+)